MTTVRAPASRAALAAATLGAEGAGVGTFDQAVMREGNHHRFVGDEVFDGHFALVWREISAARGGILFLNQGQLILDDGEYA